MTFIDGRRFVKINVGRWRVKLNGVYVIEHPSSKKFYVGSTTDLESRTIRHVLDLTRGRHANHFLQKAYRQNNNIELSIFITETRDEAYDLEQEFIDKYHAEGKLFNIATCARNSLINKTEEAREMIRLAQAERGGPRKRRKKRKWRKRRRKSK